MSLRFILGRAGSGKTHYCLSEMANLLQAKEQGPLLFLLPEQATFIHERMLACEYTAHGYGGAEVTSFRRLIWQAAKQLGQAPKPTLSDAGKSILMSRVLASRHDELRVFGVAGLGSGFARALVASAEELAAYGVEPARLVELATQRQQQQPKDSLATKLADVALLYGDYSTAVAEYDNFTAGLAFLAQAIEERGFLAGATVFVDGYASFTPAERAVLAALMQKAKRLEIALALDPCVPERSLTEHDIFYPCWQSYGQLMQIAEKLRVQVEQPLLLDGKQGRFSTNGELDFLEKHLYPWSDAFSWPEKPQHIAVTACANPREELQAVGREIQRLVREQGLRYRDISVISRDTTPYEELLPAVFGDLGIPYFVDSHKPLLYHPLVELLRSALEIWAGQPHYRHIFRYLKTGLATLSRTETDELENYCLAHGVRHWQWQADADWHYWRNSRYRDRKPEDRIEEGPPQKSGSIVEEPPDEVTVALARINNIRRRGTAALAGFLGAAPPAGEQVEAGALLAALQNLLLDLQVEETLHAWQEEALAAGDSAQAALHRQALAKLTGLLEESAALLAGSSFSAQQLLDMLDAGCASLTLSLIPPGLDEVLVASLERSRNPELGAALIIGANAESLPKKVQPEALFSDYERKELASAGLELAPDLLKRQMAEHYLAYIALTRSGGQLLLTYALSGSDGKALLASPLIKRLKQLYPGLTIQRYSQPQTPAELGSASAALPLLANKLAAARDGQQIDGFWRDVYNWFAVDEGWQPPLQRLLQGLNFQPARERLSAPTLARLYGKTLNSSVSRLEKFRSCPFAYVAAYGLKLRNRDVYEITPLARGDIFHQALARMGVMVSKRGLNWQDMDEEQATSLVDEVLEELIPEFLSGILTATARYRYLAARIRGTLITTILLLAEHMRSGAFVPVAWELPFGNREGDVLPPLIIDLGNGRQLQINGQIDRVDMALGESGAFFRVIDYKTGDISLRLQDIMEGLRMQLLVYLQVVLDNSAWFTAQAAKAAGLYYMPVRDEFASGPMPPEQEQTALAGLRLNGLTVKDAEAVRLADPQIKGHSRLIPVALSANGFYSNSPGVDEEQLEFLRGHLLGLLSETAAQMLEGLAEASPRRNANFDACAFCDYRNVCGLDRSINNA